MISWSEVFLWLVASFIQWSKTTCCSTFWCRNVRKWAKMKMNAVVGGFAIAIPGSYTISWCVQISVFRWTHGLRSHVSNEYMTPPESWKLILTPNSWEFWKSEAWEKRVLRIVRPPFLFDGYSQCVGRERGWLKLFAKKFVLNTGELLVRTHISVMPS